MAVYVDDAKIPFGRMKVSHMIADSEEELHRMAANIGMQRSWFQSKASWPHYGVSLTRRQMAIDLGAKPISQRELVLKIRELRKEQAIESKSSHS